MWSGARELDPTFEPATFLQIYATLAAQRASKILGIFSRLDRRDGKPQYLRHIPRVWGYLQRSLAHPALAPLRDWYGANLPKPATTGNDMTGACTAASARAPPWCWPPASASACGR